MAAKRLKLVVAGHGAAGLAAAVAAAEEAKRRNAAIDITILEKAREEEAGGNTRFSPSYMRMAAPDRIAPGFEADMREAIGDRGDADYFRTLAERAASTMAWLQGHGIAFTIPTYYLSVGPPRIQPVGGGLAIVERLGRAAKMANVAIHFESAATRLIVSGGRISGIEVQSAGCAVSTFEADAVVLATGGFQGDAAMTEAQFGPRARTFKLISPGTRFDTGDGIRMAKEQGARTSGDWDGMHIEPVDPRSHHPAPVVLVYPYGIVVDQTGHRFFDEGGGLVHETWEGFARDIHFSRPNSIAYAILDSRLWEIVDYQRAVRSEVAPFQSDTVEELAARIDVPPDALRQTVDAFNAAARGDVSRFDATRRDGLAASVTLVPPKSNWARPLDQPPYLAYPLIGAIAYTFGGLATNAKAEVLGDGGPIPGLYAAGETTGHFYGTAPNAVSMLRALVLGRVAGRQAADYLLVQRLP
ncbi:MAG TPA: FAD-binding protein [Bradyrhizobium sp.]|uniref:FAD-binding protein n=1 Tax=Bradyrhizobium sp. TaxID=376 RepID=UPI002C2F019C|nr:FAD-binding protein [Bradyrhizobium sp.]HLZ05323.1 FAD-binding protein [Bradyrhizobium sp.]